MTEKDQENGVPNGVGDLLKQYRQAEELMKFSSFE
jgi:hypothetical protein